MKFLPLLLLAALPAAGVDFNREIRPILSDRCFTCHGPDDQKRQAGLRLDMKEGLVSRAPKIIARITTDKKGMRMPPVSTGPALTDTQIALIKKWIEEGAKVEEHWAFEAPKRPELPAVKDEKWAKNAIDRFVLAKLERDGLKPSPEADKETLIRRVTFDLTGLPPTAAEVDAFVKDKSADAYEKVVNRLLQSPHYAEKMAMHWLDLARYADTHGYHIDSHRDMWPWRDWVIRAYQTNKPFDQFTIEQIAGDLLPNATIDQKIATGFNRNHNINFEGGAIPEEYQVEYVVDRVDATSTAWLGLTMGCARCHSHKYDPISQKEFYRFFAFFNTVSEKGLDGREGNAKPFLKLPTPEQAEREKHLREEIKATEAVLKAADKKVDEWRTTIGAEVPAVDKNALVAYYDFDGSLADVSGNYRNGRTVKGDPQFGPGQVARALSLDGQTVVALPGPGKFETSDPFTVAFWMRHGGAKQDMPVIQAIDPGTRRGMEIWLEDPDLVGIQRRASRLVIRLTSEWPKSAIVLRTHERYTQNEWVHVAYTYDGSGRASGLKLYINGQIDTPEVVTDSLAGSMASSAPLQIGFKEPDAKAYSGQLDDLRFYRRVLPQAEIQYAGVQYPIQATLSGLGGKLSKADEDRTRDYYYRYVAAPELRKAYIHLAALKNESADLEKHILNTMVMDEMEKPRDTFVLARGDYRNKTDKVTPGVPAILPPLPKTEDGKVNRLTLAKWLVDPANPLTARVAVNRYWQTYFGLGLVKTAENFGSQGEPPSNQDLLDWLATEFIRTKWDVREMQRLIVTSATYRQSSHVSRELLEKDPENRLLARGPRFRLPAEVIRDNALAVSGLLNEEVGGPSVFPYQPKGLWEEMAFGDGFSQQTYVQSHGNDLYRRSMYTFQKRTVPPAQMGVFDAPDREKCTARRSVTNTPLQALILLNDPTYMEAARVIAEKVLKEAPGQPAKRADLAFRLVTSRKPDSKELKVLTDLAKQELVTFKKDPNAAHKLLSNGESAVNISLNPAELAAWTTVASTLLNLDETVTKE